MQLCHSTKSLHKFMHLRINPLHFITIYY